MKFPKVPEKYFRHFVRGLFDGDGSVYVERKNNYLRVKLLSGSKSFIDHLNLHMMEHDFGNKSISYSHTKEKPGAFFIRYNTISEIRQFYKFVYNSVSPHIYYSRKKDIFDSNL
jgi:hypothetical protein